jgi:hypothetical protein
LKILTVLFLGLLFSQTALADHRKPTPGEVAAIIQAVEDEIYDWSYENDYTNIGNTGAISSPTDVPIFITPDLDDDGSGSVIYKFMPFGEVLRRFGFRPDGLAVLWGKPWNEFPASQPDTKTIYLADDDICAFKQRALRATFTVDPDVSRARRQEAIQRQVIRLGSSQFLAIRREKDSRKKLGLEPSGQVSVSVPALHMDASERIVGFHVEVTSGSIARFHDMPSGWNISVDNDPSWNTKIDGSTIVAAAALDIDFFRDFIVIEKEKKARNPFDVKGEVIVSKDFSHVRKIQVGMKDFVVREYVQPRQSRSSN